MARSRAGKGTASTQSVAGRRAGYAIVALINAIVLWLVNVAPGWDVLPFLTADFSRVLGLVNASTVAGLVVNLVYLVRDPRWLVALGSVITTAIGLAAIVAMLRVFPFAFDPGGFDWAAVVRVLLVVALVGSCIGLVVNLVTLVRALGSGSGSHRVETGTRT
ncbi:MAG: hypothetical protein ACXVX8_05670 [Blastococcus sp.]